MKSSLKENKFWKKTKPSKKFKEQYKKETGLDAKELYLATSKYYKMLEKLLVK